MFFIQENFSSFKGLLKNFVFPILFYFVFFYILTYPMLNDFSTHFFCDAGDGYQNIWNIWWVRYAIRVLHQNPYFTDYLMFPHGTTLVAHTLNPFNGLIAVLTHRFLSLVQTHNLIVVFSFVVGGLTAFWLSLYVTTSFVGSLIAGFIFTFSSYHFAHAEGHLQLVSLEWIPLFVLAWKCLLDSPTIRKGIFAALVLGLVILCDYYYFFFCVLTGIILYGWTWLSDHKENRSEYFKNSFPSLMAFLVACLATSGSLLLAISRLASSEVTKGHVAEAHSLDLLAPFIPGGHWRFYELTQFFWEKLPGNIHEGSVHLGISAVILVVVAMIHRKQSLPQKWGVWLLPLVFFVFMSLGPKIFFNGKVIPYLRGPYALLEMVLPAIKISGCPVRMMVMVNLFFGIFAGAGFAYLIKRPKRDKVIALLLAGILFVEYLPRPIPEVKAKYPEIIEEIHKKINTSGEYGYMDLSMVFQGEFALYLQTLLEIPMYGGEISRLPNSVALKNEVIGEFAKKYDWKTLCEIYGFRYLIFMNRDYLIKSLGEIPVLVDYAGFAVYDLQHKWICKRTPRILH